MRGDYVVWMRGRVEMMARPSGLSPAELMLNDVLGALETLAEPVIAIKGHIILSVNDATLTTFGYRFDHIYICLDRRATGLIIYTYV